MSHICYATLQELQFPTTVSELQELVAILKEYHDSHYLYLLTLFSAAYVYKQTFAIPGSALMVRIQSIDVTLCNIESNFFVVKYCAMFYKRRV